MIILKHIKYMMVYLMYLYFI